MSTLFEQIGGEPQLRRIIDTFVDRVFEDAMIGFFFAQVDRQRVKDKEYEFAAAHLGADIQYTGRPIATAHARHPIMGGHFMRRLQILKDTLDEFGVPQQVREHWVQHTEKLRPAVTEHQGSDCAHGDGSVGPSQPRRLPLAFKAPVGAERRELPLATSGAGGQAPNRPLPVTKERKDD